MPFKGAFIIKQNLLILIAFIFSAVRFYIFKFILKGSVSGSVIASFIFINNKPGLSAASAVNINIQAPQKRRSPDPALIIDNKLEIFFITSASLINRVLFFKEFSENLKIFFFVRDKFGLPAASVININI